MLRMSVVMLVAFSVLVLGFGGLAFASPSIPASSPEISAHLNPPVSPMTGVSTYADFQCRVTGNYTVWCNLEYPYYIARSWWNFGDDPFWYFTEDSRIPHVYDYQGEYQVRVIVEFVWMNGPKYGTMSHRIVVPPHITKTVISISVPFEDLPPETQVVIVIGVTVFLVAALYFYYLYGYH